MSKYSEDECCQYEKFFDDMDKDDNGSICVCELITGLEQLTGDHDKAIDIGCVSITLVFIQAKFCRAFGSSNKCVTGTWRCSRDEGDVNK